MENTTANSFTREDLEDMKLTVKHYAYYRLGKVKPQTAFHDINSKLPIFIEYCDLNNINSFNEVTKEVFLNYSLWIKEEKGISSGYAKCKTVEEIIKIGQIKGWDVPKSNIFIGFTSSDLWDSEKSLKENKKILYMDISTSEIKLAVKVIKEVDEEAFISISPIQNIYGKFYIKPLK